MALFGTITDQSVQGCGKIVAAGSRIFIGALPNCATEAIEYTLTTDAVQVLNDEEISVTVPATAGFDEKYIRKGEIIVLSGGATATVTADTLLVLDGATSNTIPVTPLSAAVAIGETYTSWLLLEFLSPSDLPLNSADTMVDTTDLASGLQGSEQKTNVALSVTVQGFLVNNDLAVCDIHDASQKDIEATVVIARNGGFYAIGRAIIGNLQYSGAAKEVVNVQFDVMFQPPYDFTPPSWCLSTATLAALNTQLALAGLAQEV